jgi:hypothetical protein
VSADASLRRLGVPVITVVQDRLLIVAEEGFHRIIVRTSLGQTRPMQSQLPHQTPGLFRLAGMGWVLIQSDPHRLSGIPPSDPTHELADILRSLTAIVRPADSAMIDIVQGKQVEPAARFLLGLKDQFFLPGVAPPTVGLDRDRLDIEEGQDTAATTVPP